MTTKPWRHQSTVAVQTGKVQSVKADFPLSQRSGNRMFPRGRDEIPSKQVREKVPKQKQLKRNARSSLPVGACVEEVAPKT